MYPEAKMIPPMKIWKIPSDMEAYKLPEILNSKEYFAEEKIDGYWYQYEKTEHYSYLFSRNVSKTTGYYSEKGENVPHIMKALDSCLPPNTTLIGEIFYPGKTSKEVTTIMGCLPATAIKRQKNNPIHYYIHDIIQYDGCNLINCPAWDRYKILKAIWDKHYLGQFNFLKLAFAFDTKIQERLDIILKVGGEGLVLKKKNLPYYPDKRPAWSTIKIKRTDSVDLVCIGFCPATKKYTGKDLETWEYWETPDGLQEGRYYINWIKDKDNYTPITKPYFFGWKTALEVGAYDNTGKLVKIGTVSSGLTDEDKNLILKNPEEFLNHVVSIDCMQIDKNEHTLRHPHFIKIREDKPAKDCLIEEIFS